MSDHAAYVRATMRPLEVAETGMAAKLPRLAGIRAVVFDLYGTLLVSSAGGAPPGRAPDAEGLPGSGRLLGEAIRRHQEERRRRKGIVHPEVEIREVWADVLADLGEPPRPREEIEWLVLRHECRVHPTWPMPGAAEVLRELRGAGFLLGIVSNAQFYTLPMVEGLFGGDLDALGFHPELRVFSYEAGEGKPSAALFGRLVERAATLGIAPGEMFHLGNDFRKDVLPARAAGLRTGWFAGDAASFRSGGVPEAAAAEIADAVVVDLAQVPGLFQGGS